MKTRIFLILFVAGMLGVVSLLLIDLNAVVELIPPTSGAEIPTITPAIKLLTLVQPTLFLAVAVVIGVALAPRVGLSSPFAECVARGGRCVPELKPQVAPGLLGGLVGGMLIVLTSSASRPFLMTETIDRLRAFGQFVPIPTRILYGGITEELLLRWGFMTVIVWIAWRVLARQASKPTTMSYVLAILISSVVFGLGHLPVALTLLPESGIALILFVILGNSEFGIVAGYLYWRYGLESAIIAHMFCHVVLALAHYAGVYF